MPHFSPISSLLQLFVIFTSTATLVRAHGYVHSITLDGVTYQGADPYGSAISSPIRQISSNSPATPVDGDINGPAMTCGGGAQPASLTVPMTAGSDVSIYWGSWPHNVGPIITYLGKCDGSCATTDPSKIDFFKIHQVDFVPGTHTWVQSQTVYKGLPFNFTLPDELPNGDFIMRHEIIALHNAMNPGGAESYPQCIQVSIDCGDGKIPAATAKFPGAYSATDPGILINIYDDPDNLVYTFPGPALALEEDPEDNGDDDSSSSTSSSSPTSTPPTTSTTSSSTSTSASASTTSTTASASSTTTSSSSSSASTSASSSDPGSASSGSTTSDTAKASTSASTVPTTTSNASTTSEMATTSPRRSTTRHSSSTITSPASNTSPVSTSSSTTSTTSTADPTESVSMDLQNGRDAIALNQKYQTVVAGTSCPNYEIGCIGDAFGQCVWGTWVATKCPGGTVCAALPNVGSPGTSIACTTPADRDMRIAITGATLRMKRHRRHKLVGLH